ncbi:unnamed protein product [Dicrocoelium dendriticum]|nr:unnamed protein product [Dicrocoelium dendriticum]
MGYIQKDGEKMMWRDELGEPGNLEASKIKGDVCERMNHTMVFLTHVPSNEMDCQLLSLSGHPKQSYIEVNINSAEEDGKSVNVTEFVKKLYHFFSKTTKQKRRKRGPVVGNVTQHVAIAFAVDIYENGQLSEWRTAYDEMNTLKKIEKSICPALTRWSKKAMKRINLKPTCTFYGPSGRIPLGHFRLEFRSDTKHILNQETVVMSFKTTPAIPGSIYNIGESRFHFQILKPCTPTGTNETEETEATDEKETGVFATFNCLTSATHAQFV